MLFSLSELGNYAYIADMLGRTVELQYQATEVAVRPSTVYKPRLVIDGDQWCALYGENLQAGVAGFGKSPADAFAAFDSAWTKKLEKPVKKEGPEEEAPGRDCNACQCSTCDRPCGPVPCEGKDFAECKSPITDCNAWRERTNDRA